MCLINLLWMTKNRAGLQLFFFAVPQFWMITLFPCNLEAKPVKLYVHRHLPSKICLLWSLLHEQYSFLQPSTIPVPFFGKMQDQPLNVRLRPLKTTTQWQEQLVECKKAFNRHVGKREHTPRSIPGSQWFLSLAPIFPSTSPCPPGNVTVHCTQRVQITGFTTLYTQQDKITSVRLIFDPISDYLPKVRVFEISTE